MKKSESVEIPSKQDVLNLYLARKKELERYSMAIAFKKFAAINKSKFNDLKTLDDCEKAFIEFYSK